jgi:hypothetical protein
MGSHYLLNKWSRNATTYLTDGHFWLTDSRFWSRNATILNEVGLLLELGLLFPLRGPKTPIKALGLLLELGLFNIENTVLEALG